MKDVSDNNLDEYPEKCRDFLEIFNNSAGIISVACKKFGISRTTFQNWRKQFPRFKEALTEYDESIKDFGESQLLTLMRGSTKEVEESKDVLVTVGDKKEKITLVNKHVYKNPPDTAAVIFYLKTKCRERGYVEHTVIQSDLNSEKPLTHEELLQKAKELGYSRSNYLNSN